MAKKPVFFIATRYKKEPVKVHFYTQKGKLVDFKALEKVKTKESIEFYVKEKPNRN